MIATAKKALLDGQARLIRVSPTKGGEVEEGIVDFGMTCHSGGTLDIFLEPFAARPSLLIIGTAPSAQALAGLAQRTGFDVSVAFPEAKAEMFPDAGQVIDGLDLAELAGATPEFVVVATQGKRDEPGLEAALSTGAPYIAFIASGRKADKLRTYLKERGHDPAARRRHRLPGRDRDRRRDPRGDRPVGARRTGQGPPRRHGCPLSPRVGEPLPKSMPDRSRLPDLKVRVPGGEGRAIDPVCGMSVDIAERRIPQRAPGAELLFLLRRLPAQLRQGAGAVPADGGSDTA